MSVVSLKRRFNCNGDCCISGCVGHSVELKFNSATCSYAFTIDNETEYYFNDCELDSIIRLVGELSNRRRDSIRLPMTEPSAKCVNKREL